ncbi:MAG: flagellar protein FlaG [Methylobacter sp.]|jgi:flagellar protein FlaG
MNSEITNVSKLVPATVMKSNRQSEETAALPADGLKERASGSNVTAVDTLKSAAVAGNSILQAVNRNLEFQVDDSTKKVVVKIVDNQSGETVRQIPSEDMMTFIKKMQELDGKTGSVIQDRA